MNQKQEIPANTILKPSQFFKITRGSMEGSEVANSQRTLGEMASYYMDQAALQKLDPNEIIYRVQSHMAVPEGSPGGIYFGTTFIKPGQVGKEYFMTKGHFHSKPECGEYYFCIKGTGVLILMNRQRVCRGEHMASGTLHYVPGETAHRVANCGNEELVFSACWPSDAGHNYEEIEKNGFSSRLLEHHGAAQLVNG